MTIVIILAVLFLLIAWRYAVSSRELSNANKYEQIVPASAPPPREFYCTGCRRPAEPGNVEQRKGLLWTYFDCKCTFCGNEWSEPAWE